MARLARPTILVALSLLTSAATASAQNAWVLWRRFIPADNPEASDPRLWRAQPGSKTKTQCESEVKEYRALDPNKTKCCSTPLVADTGSSTTVSRILRTRAYRRRSE
jgi:hypothetical protein